MTNTSTDHLSHHISVQSPNQTSAPLLNPSSKPQDELWRVRNYLRWTLLDQSSPGTRIGSFAAFLVFGLAVPGLAAVTVKDPPGADPSEFNRLVQVPSSGLAVMAFLSVALRRPLLLDDAGASPADSPTVRRRHAAELNMAFRRLALILFPSFFVEVAHKALLFSSAEISFLRGVATARSVAFVLVLASWVYRSGIFLLVCVMFRLTCELQILRLEGFQKMFESSNVEVGVIFEEHLRIRKQLWVTSHRYRFFIIGSLFIITVSQFGALLLVLGSKSQKNFLNSGDLVVCSAVEISGFFLCLVGAARITHRAQRIVSVATKWHMLVTCASSRPDQPKAQILSQPNHDDNDNPPCGESSDSDSSEILISDSPQDPSSFHARQALVAYLEHNNGGITLFGFVLDRGLLHTLFAFEFSLVLWILSKVVVLS